MTISKPTTMSEDIKYKEIKRKLKETMEMNDSLSRNYLRAKKKIRTLTFERNLLLDSISKMSPYQQNSNSHSSDDDDITQSDTESDILLEAPSSLPPPPPIKSTPRIPRRNQQTLDQNKLITVASAPPKRSRINRINVKTRRVQPIERDINGNPVLPQQIGVLTVLNLGKIITDRDTFHNERYIFPVGYTVRRTYPSMINPTSNTVITSTILDGGDGPRFHVVAADQVNQPIVANSATGAWTVVVKKSNEIRHREHSNSASGPDYYGFKHPTIAKMIQDLPGTKDLRNYIWQHFEEMEPKAAKGVMAAAEKKRDNLEQMGNANRKITTNHIVETTSSASPSLANTTITFDHAYQPPPPAPLLNDVNTYAMADTDEEIDELGGSDNDV